MDIVFNNIDGKYIKSRPEFLGDIQPKFWFTSKDGSVLVKRQHSQKVNGQAQKSKMFNHYGEYFGYLLAKKAGIKACPADLITLHDTKNKYSQTLRFYTACYSKKVLSQSQSLIHGEHIVSWFMSQYPEQYQKIISESNCFESKNSFAEKNTEDNIDVVIAAITAYTAIREEENGIPSDKIKADIHENLTNAFEMFAYDCLFGNNDRHSQNWAMCVDSETGRIEMYPLYDNERVLGLSIPEAEVKRDSFSQNLPEKIEKHNFSRMGTAPSHSSISYKALLTHLVVKYPDYAIPAIEKIIDRVEVQDIIDMYEATEGILERSEARDELRREDALPIEYKIYGTTLYSDRSEYARGLLERTKNIKVNKKTKNDDDGIRQ